MICRVKLCSIILQYNTSAWIYISRVPHPIIKTYYFPKSNEVSWLWKTKAWLSLQHTIYITSYIIILKYLIEIIYLWQSDIILLFNAYVFQNPIKFFTLQKLMAWLSLQYAIYVLSYEYPLRYLIEIIYLWQQDIVLFWICGNEREDEHSGTI